MKKLIIAIALAWLLVLSTGEGLAVLPTLADTDYTIELTQVDDSDYPRISLYLSITDDASQPVGGLTKDEFTVLEDSQEVPILDFAGIGDERPVDVVFVFDTTGSMDDEIEGVKQRCVAFAQELESKRRDYRLGLVTFWDTIQGVYNSDRTLTDDVQVFKGWIEELRAGGGDDGPELALEAMVEGSQMQFRDDAQRVLILITDASPHHRDDSSGFSNLTMDETLERLRAARITLFAVAPDLTELPEKDSILRQLPGRHGLPAQNEYGRLVGELGGKFYNIAHEPDFTGIIDEIGGLIASQYCLTYESARPSHDGTRRGIVVKIGESSGTGDYVEKHLLNVRSELLVGVLFLAPLLLALAVPAALGRQRAAPVAPPPVGAGPPLPPPAAPPAWPAPAPPSPPIAPVADSTACPQCGNPLRREARFCGRCGFSQSKPPAPPPRQQALVCPHCGQTLRPGVQFCGSCGNQV